jgi:hypothetical protein
MIPAMPRALTRTASRPRVRTARAADLTSIVFPFLRRKRHCAGIREPVRRPAAATQTSLTFIARSPRRVYPLIETIALFTWRNRRVSAS